MSEQHEMNLFDLCIICAKAIGRFCKSVIRFCGKVVQLSFRKWWIVVPVMVVAIAGTCYFSRKENLIYKVNAVAVLNGPSRNLFMQSYQPIEGAWIGESNYHPIAYYLQKQIAYRFTTFPVIDCQNDSTADYIDFNRQTKITDTIDVQMQDHICMQFRIKNRNLHLLPDIENALMDYLNGIPQMQASYQTYLQTLDRQVLFCHDQIEKLDSLTTAFYFPEYPVQQLSPSGTSLLIGDRRIRLFLPQIHDHFSFTQRTDQRKTLATAPVVLVNHFVADPHPVNSLLKCIVLFGLAGFVIGCIIALLVEQRKAIGAWLRK